MTCPYCHDTGLTAENVATLYDRPVTRVDWCICSAGSRRLEAEIGHDEARVARRNAIEAELYGGLSS